VSAEDILSKPQPPPDERSGVRRRLQSVSRGASAAHGGAALRSVEHPRWLLAAKYDLAHTGHLCEALRAAGVATFNIEYRRVGNAGGGWPGSFADIRSAYRFVQQDRSRFHLDLDRLAVMDIRRADSLPLCLAAHETSLRGAVSLAGVVDLKKAFALHLSNEAVAEFLGGKPDARAGALPGSGSDGAQHSTSPAVAAPRSEDDTVPPEFSRDYVMQKKKAGESAQLLEIPHAGHFDVLDPASEAFKEVRSTVLTAVSTKG